MLARAALLTTFAALSFASAAVAQTAPSRPLDAARVVRHVRFAFHANGERYESAPGAYRVDATSSATTLGLDGGARLTLRTLAIGRDGRRDEMGAPHARVDERGVLVVSRGASTETLENTEDGLEQQWRFATRPQGHGDLVVRVRVDGMAFVSESAFGLHFGDAHALVRYGNVAWIDATGRRTALRPVRHGHEIELRVPSNVIDTAQYPAALDPTIGPETAVDAPFYSPAPAFETVPAIASDGTDYLVVWSDQRGFDGGDIYGARVTASGTLLDQAGIAISTAQGVQTAPAVAFDGTNYLVVWQDARSMSTQQDIFAARVTTSGSVLDANGVAVSTAGYGQKNPSLAFNGSEYLAVWEDGRAAGPPDIYGARIQIDTTVLDPNGIAVSIEPGSQLRPRVTANGGNFFAVWSDERVTNNSDVYATPIDASGVVGNPNGIAIVSATFNQNYDADVASSGSNLLVAWVQGYSLLGERLDPVTFAPIDAAPLTIMQSAQNRQQVAIAYGSGYYLVTCEQDPLNFPSITGTWVNASSGVVYQPFSETTFSDFVNTAATPAVASNGSNFLVGWQGQNSGPIHARTASTPGSALGAIAVVGTAANHEAAPAIDWDATQWFAAWIDQRSGTSNVYGARIDASGQPIDSPAIAISISTAAESDVVVSHDAQNFFVLWTDDRSYAASSDDLYAARVRRDTGVVLDPNGIPISTAYGSQNSPAIDFDGTNYFAVWSDQRSHSSGDLYGARISAATGQAIDVGGLALATDSASHESPTIVFDGAQHEVAWAYYYFGSYGLEGLHVDTSGVPIETMPVSLSTTADDLPRLAFGANELFLTWTTSNISGARWVSGQVLNRDFTPVSSAMYPRQLSMTTDAYQPAATFDGFNFVASWYDLTTNLAYAAWIRPDGTVLPASRPTIDTLRNDGPPSIAGDGTGTSLVAYPRYEPLPPYGNTRVWVRSLTLGTALGTTCLQNEDCASGFCVDGVCCDTACGGGASDCEACSVAAGAMTDGHCGAVSAGTVCRPVAGACDVAETCDGATTVCPADAFLPATMVCRASTGACDPAESCTGTQSGCPSDVQSPNGATCDDGNPCTMGDVCSSGVCAGTMTPCAPPDACHSAGVCDPSSGLCTYAALPDTTPCDDMNACTMTDRCMGGVCVGSDSVPCTAQDSCHLAGSCDPTTGMCSNPAGNDGTPCSGGTCSNGSCVAPVDASVDAPVDTGVDAADIVDVSTHDVIDAHDAVVDSGARDVVDARDVSVLRDGANDVAVTDAGADVAADTSTGEVGSEPATSGGSHGCSCRVPAAPSGPRNGAWLFAFAVGMVARRRRRTRSA